MNCGVEVEDKGSQFVEQMSQCKKFDVFADAKKTKNVFSDLILANRQKERQEELSFCGTAVCGEAFSSLQRGICITLHNNSQMG